MKKSVTPFLLKSVWLLGLILLLGGTGMAQKDHKITTGMVYYQQGEFGDAIKAFDEGLEDLSQLRGKNIPKGFFHRAMSRMKYMQQIVRNISSAEDKEAEAKKYKEELDGLMLKVYEDFKMARQHDDGKWGDKIDQQMTAVGAAILQAGLQALNSSFTENLSKEDKQKAYSETVKYMKIAEEIRPQDYMVNDLAGQALLAAGDSSKALVEFGKAMAKYEKEGPTRPDLLVSYVYYRAALLDRYYDKNIDNALKHLDAGKAALKTEWKRYQEKKDSYPAEAWTSIEKQYAGANADLSNFELDLLLNSPDKLQDAISKFEKAVEEEPDNYIKHVAFAQLLERVDNKRAEDVYLKATKIDASKHLAWFNLGALYVNQAVELYKEANKIEDDYEKAKSMQEEADGLYKKAYPFLQKAQEIEACDSQTLDALLNICINLGADDEQMMADYKKYKDQQKKCRNGG